VESYEFLLSGRPMSVHAKNTAAREAWRERVKIAAIIASPGLPPFTQTSVRLTIVFLSHERAKLDVDNVIKPIQDALTLAFYADDEVVSDVDAHRRTWTDPGDAELLPDLLKAPWKERRECVYVRVEETRPLEELL
jgi:Holliday junction resolvase RusA-like endonuclease